MGARASKTQSFVLRQKRWMHTQTQRHFLEHLNVASFKHDRHKSSAQLHEFHNPKLHISFQISVLLCFASLMSLFLGF